tara:strand:+ start:332 stop:778 length:447 start_codon:yes stop_codon:yes gene_type:complete
MIDKNKLFSLFGSSDDDNIDEKKSIKEFEKLVEAELEQPMNKLGMFVKLIINHMVFHQKLKKFLDKESPGIIDLETTKEASAFAVFNRAWHYIKGMDLKEKKHCQAVMEYKSGPLRQTLGEAIFYFESVEEYEKCAFLYTIQKLKEKS